MSYLLPHLRTGWAVDQAILNEEDRVVVIRFGHDYDPVCMQMDEALSKIVEKVKNFAVIYLVDITEVPDFNTMRASGALWRVRLASVMRRPTPRYELYDPCTVMNFFRNKHIMIDLGTGNNNKINWALTNTQELIDLVETAGHAVSTCSEERGFTVRVAGLPRRAQGSRIGRLAQGLFHKARLHSARALVSL